MGVFPCEGREGSLEQRYGWDGARVGGGKGIWRGEWDRAGLVSTGVLARGWLCGLVYRVYQTRMVEFLEW